MVSIGEGFLSWVLGDDGQGGRRLLCSEVMGGEEVIVG
jgi:hypothetical protein